jgi:hypothetical protein
MSEQNDAIKKNKKDTRKSIEQTVRYGKVFANARLSSTVLIYQAINKGYIKLEYIDIKKDPNGKNKIPLGNLKLITNNHLRYFREVYTKEYLGVAWTIKTHKNNLDALRDAIMGAITLHQDDALAEVSGKHLEGKKEDRIWVKSKFVSDNNPDANPNKATGNIALSFSQLEQTCQSYWSRKGKGSGGTSVRNVDGEIDKLSVSLTNDMNDKQNSFLRSTVKTISRLNTLSNIMSDYTRRYKEKNNNPSGDTLIKTGTDNG